MILGTIPAAIRECRQAGIRVVMITGDHPVTAVQIAREIGLSRDHAVVVLTGAGLDGVDDDSLRGRIGSVEVFARVRPEQKLRIVRALQENGEERFFERRDFEQFRYGFANAVSEKEARELYERYAVPGSGTPLFQAAMANRLWHGEFPMDHETWCDLMVSDFPATGSMPVLPASRHSPSTSVTSRRSRTSTPQASARIEDEHEPSQSKIRNPRSKII